MLDVEQATQEILKNQPQAVPVDVSLSEANGLVLAQDVVALIALPVFDNSAMDGFALRSDDVALATPDVPVRLRIIGDIWAGKVSNQNIEAGTCIRIMTGAKIPPSTSAVIMKENVTTQGNVLLVSGPVKYFENIRRRGEEIKPGDLLLCAGKKITASGIGLLASAGLTNVSVYPQPRVVIIPTGTELICPGQSLKDSQIYESNSYALRAALEDMGISPQVIPVVADDKMALLKTIQAALKTATHILLCGGVSVGDHDHSKSILADCGVKEVFWGVKQKPGKPLYFGLCGQTSVFGLPGNPVSSLVCFYEYVRVSLLKYKNSFDDQKKYNPKKMSAFVVGSLRKKAGSTHFIRARAYFDNHVLRVEPLALQGSHMMTGFAEANCLLVFPKATEELHDGSLATIHLLPQEELYDG